MKQLRVDIDSDIHTDLKLLAVKQNTTVSELVRDAVMRLVDPSPKSSPKPILEVKNIKVNKNGTLSPKDPTKPSQIKAIRPTLEVCKNGHILSFTGRCTQKDCKYA